VKAGRELDALVAEKVMGKTIIYLRTALLDREPFIECDPEQGSHLSLLPWYSTDIAAAWEVVEKLASVVYEAADSSWQQTVRVYSCPTAANCWHCEISREFGRGENCLATGDTASEAICLAALAAVGVEVPA
jgi:hypothetical protein